MLWTPSLINCSHLWGIIPAVSKETVTIKGEKRLQVAGEVGVNSLQRLQQRNPRVLQCRLLRGSPVHVQATEQETGTGFFYHCINASLAEAGLKLDAMALDLSYQIRVGSFYRDIFQLRVYFDRPVGHKPALSRDTFSSYVKNITLIGILYRVF